MKPVWIAAVILILTCLYGPHFDTASSPSIVLKPDREWVMTWSDEFNGPNGSPPDPTKWSIVSGGNGWGNNELEYYTSRNQNVHLDHGKLVIEAVKEDFIGPDGVHRHYTSGRMKTAGHFSQKYGRFEARIKIPFGQGLWPAFWMLGDDIATKGWPACGEIDIMENSGIHASKISGTLHGPGYSANKGPTSAYILPKGKFSDKYHIFSVEWEPEVIRFYADGKLYSTRTPADLPLGKVWVFDHPFFIILNLAVGGNFPGNPDDTTLFPQRMLVDYVRVYSRKTDVP